MKPSVMFRAALPMFLILCAPLNAQKFFGGIWQRWNSQGEVPGGFDDLFNQVTPENAGKWGSLDWNALEAMYAYAEARGLVTKQHTFVWGQQQPGGVGSAREVEDWMAGYMDRFAGKVDLIDVVNEPISAPPAYKNAIGGDGGSGWDWVVWSFETARRLAPASKLLLNDFSILSEGDKINTYLEIVRLLQKEDLIDGLGVQCHGLEETAPDTIKNKLDILAQTGLPIYVSELDVSLSDDQAQLQRYQDLFPVFWRHPGVWGITLWGYQEGRIWRGDAYLVRSDGSERPALGWLKEYMADTPPLSVDHKGTILGRGDGFAITAGGAALFFPGGGIWESGNLPGAYRFAPDGSVLTALPLPVPHGPGIFFRPGLP